MFAAALGQREIIEFLLAYEGIDISVKDSTGRTALEICRDGIQCNKKLYPECLKKFQQEKSLEDSRINNVTEKLNLLEEIGKGSEGIVMKAQWKDPKDGREPLAVKIMLKGGDIGTLKQQILLNLSLQHDNLMKTIGWGVDKVNVYEIQPCMTMNLLKYIEETAKLTDKVDKMSSLKEKLFIIKSILEGLKYLHERQPQIIHRDLKPENILLLMSSSSSASSSGNNNENQTMIIKECRIGDFGISIQKSLQKTHLQTSSRVRKGTTISTIREFAGTQYYLPPEILTISGFRTKDHSYAYYTDIYAFGIILYELLTGELNQFQLEALCKGFLVDDAMKRMSDYELKSSSSSEIFDKIMKALFGLVIECCQSNFLSKSSSSTSDNEPEMNPDIHKQRPTTSKVLIEVDKLIQSLKDEEERRKQEIIEAIHKLEQENKKDVEEMIEMMRTLELMKKKHEEDKSKREQEIKKLQKKLEEMIKTN